MADTTYRHLLAKKKNSGDDNAFSNMSLIQGHTKQVMEAIETVLDLTKHCFLNTGLIKENDYALFNNAAKLAAFLHDLGKANSHFQKLIQGNYTGIFRQGMRHEAISLIIANLVLLKNNLLLKTQNDAVLIAMCAVVCHHFKENFGEIENLSGLTDLKIYCSHPDFIETLKMYFNEVKIEELKDVVLSLSILDENSAYIILSNIRNALIEKFNEISEETKTLIACVKSVLIMSDVLASSYNENDDIKNYITSLLSASLEEKKILSIVNERLNGAEPREFQKRIGGAAKRITIVQAGCGSGKTVGAYMWAGKHAVKKRLFFCYPTTGTTSEGFLDYIYASQTEGNLIHSRSIADIDRMTQNGEENPSEMLLKCDALENLSIPLNICTIDTVLSLLVNGRKAIYLFPAFVNSVFIFDEIHSYDHKLFVEMLQFMKLFKNVSFLLMSASITETQKSALITNFGTEIEWISGPEEWEELPRYQLAEINETEIWQRILREYNAGNKILCVSNTIHKTVEYFQNAQKEKLNCFCYHSRFKYEDRVSRHRDVIDSFKNNLPVICFTTQVAEMSLDIDADFLVSEFAPIPSLIQRLGRLNRKASKKTIPPKTAIFIEPKTPLPYKQQDIDKAKEWVSVLCKKQAVSQKELSLEMQNLQADETEYSLNDSYCHWIKGIWKMEQDSVRDGNFSLRVILQSDYIRIQNENNHQEKQKILINSELSMPPCSNLNEIINKPHYKGRIVLPDEFIEYNVKEGAKWKKK